jgi:prepilin signal peptidase PulO-like enzyme (type II secretory pathway)
VAELLFSFAVGWAVGLLLPRLARRLVQKGNGDAVYRCAHCRRSAESGRPEGFFDPGNRRTPLCRSCGRRLFPPAGSASWLTGGGFAAAQTVWGGTGELWVAWLLVSILVLVVLTDFWAMIIPDAVTVPGMVLFFLMRLWVRQDSFSLYLLGFVVSFLLPYIIARMTGGMGGGDVKLLAMSGMALGWPNGLLALALAVTSGGLHALYMMAKGGRRRDPLPFGPHLAAGIFVAHGWGGGIIDWYGSFFFGTKGLF